MRNRKFGSAPRPKKHMRGRNRPPPRNADPLKPFKPAVNPTSFPAIALDAQLKDKRPLPMQNTNPVWHQANKEQEFYNTQVSSGVQILTTGRGIDNAADAQNVNVARTELNWQTAEEPAFTPTTDPTKPQEPDPHFNRDVDPASAYSQPLGNEKMWWESAGINADHLNEADFGPDPLHGDPMGFGKKMP